MPRMNEEKKFTSWLTREGLAPRSRSTDYHRYVLCAKGVLAQLMVENTGVGADGTTEFQRKYDQRRNRFFIRGRHQGQHRWAVLGEPEEIAARVEQCVNYAEPEVEEIDVHEAATVVPEGVGGRTEVISYRIYGRRAGSGGRWNLIHATIWPERADAEAYMRQLSRDNSGWWEFEVRPARSKLPEGDTIRGVSGNGPETQVQIEAGGSWRYTAQGLADALTDATDVQVFTMVAPGYGTFVPVNDAQLDQLREFAAEAAEYDPDAISAGWAVGDAVYIRAGEPGGTFDPVHGV